MRRHIPGLRWLRLLRGRLVWVVVLAVAVPALLDLVIGVLHPLRDGNQTCRIVQVVDGDTVRLWCNGTDTERARLTGFDAPELFSPKCTAEVVAAQQAKWALRLMLLWAAELQMQRRGTDRYGRSLVALSDGPVLLAARMIAAGNGRAYDGGRRGGWCTGEQDAAAQDRQVISGSAA